MNRHHCADCGDNIPNGRAHIRSMSFRQVALCGFCHPVANGEALLAELASEIPAQRRPSALSLRLAARRVQS